MSKVSEEDIRRAAQVVCQGFAAGVFVRDVSHDHESGWAFRALPYLVALGVLADAFECKDTDSQKQVIP